MIKRAIITTTISADAELLSLTQAMALSNLGKETVRKIAADAGAVRKIGRSYRINRKLFFDYIEQHYSQG